MIKLLRKRGIFPLFVLISVITLSCEYIKENYDKKIIIEFFNILRIQDLEKIKSISSTEVYFLIKDIKDKYGENLVKKVFSNIEIKKIERNEFLDYEDFRAYDVTFELKLGNESKLCLSIIYIKNKKIYKIVDKKCNIFIKDF